MRKLYIAGNWKMHTDTQEAVALASGLVETLRNVDKTIMIAPPFTVLSKIAPILHTTKILLGAQNCSHELSGAYTGEVSAHMLKDVGVQVVILGHSERRIYFGENNVLINKKVQTALQSGLDVILCVGETLEERENGMVKKVVDKQLVGGLDRISAEQLKHITIAYEPVWAIGTGKTATAKDANEVHVMIRTRIGELYGEQSAQEIIIQYGGSVKPDNAHQLLAEEHIDGALVGGASLDVTSFTDIVISA